MKAQKDWRISMTDSRETGSCVALLRIRSKQSKTHIVVLTAGGVLLGLMDGETLERQEWFPASLAKGKGQDHLLSAVSASVA